MSGNDDAMGGGGSLMDMTQPPPAPQKSYSFAETGRDRCATLPLEWPLMAPDGAVIEALTLRRLKGSEVAAVQEAMMAGAEAKMLAIFTGAAVDLIEALDQDDLIELKKRLFDFLPRSLRGALEAAQAEMLDRM